MNKTLLRRCLPAAMAAAMAAAPKTETIRYKQGRRAGALAHKALSESSGVAASRRRPDLWWTHNDSGDSSRLFAFGPRGEHRGTATIRGVKNRDWEDMASFSLNGKPYLLVADIGDNNRKHDTSRLHVIAEPDISTAIRPVAAVKPIATIVFRYEDGPHDCEAVAVDAPGRAIYLITKEALPVATVARLPLRVTGDADKKPMTAKTIARVGLSMATGMDISPDGRRMVVSTYGDTFEFSRGADQSWEEALRTPPRRIPTPNRRQGEAICYNHDGRSLCLTSEKRPAPVFMIDATPMTRTRPASSARPPCTTRPVPLPRPQKAADTAG